MADYIFIRKSRNALSSLLHVILNLLLAGVSIWITVVTGSPLIGLILVAISKWRVLAVNHRYWFINIRASLVDVIVGVSFVLLAYAAGTTFLPVHFILMVAYAIWLIVLKPRSSFNFVMVQALTAVLTGTAAAAVFAAITNEVVLVVSEFVIGYAASRHVLSHGSETDASLMSCVVGLVAAEVAWLSHTWLIIYTLSSLGLCMPQLALVLTVLMFGYFQVYREATERGKKLRFADVALPLAFCLVVVAVLVIGFSEPRFNIH